MANIARQAFTQAVLLGQDRKAARHLQAARRAGAFPSDWDSDGFEPPFHALARGCVEGSWAGRQKDLEAFAGLLAREGCDPLSNWSAGAEVARSAQAYAEMRACLTLGPQTRPAAIKLDPAEESFLRSFEKLWSRAVEQSSMGKMLAAGAGRGAEVRKAALGMAALAVAWEALGAPMDCPRFGGAAWALLGRRVGQGAQRELALRALEVAADNAQDAFEARDEAPLAWALLTAKHGSQDLADWERLLMERGCRAKATRRAGSRL